jgi:hypothetical protein
MKNDPRVTHRYIKYVGKQLPCNVRLIPNLKHQFEVRGEVIPVTPAQHAAMLRHPMLYADSSKTEFEGSGSAETEAVEEEVSEGSVVGDHTDAFVIPSAEMFCRKTANEIKGIDYTEIPTDTVMAYLDAEMAGKARSTVTVYLENLIELKMDGAYRFGGD